MRVKSVKGMIKALESMPSLYYPIHFGLCGKVVYLTKEKVKLDFESLTYLNFTSEPINKKSVRVERGWELKEALEKFPGTAVVRTKHRIPGGEYEFIDNTMGISQNTEKYMFGGSETYIYLG